MCCRCHGYEYRVTVVHVSSHSLCMLLGVSLACNDLCISRYHEAVKVQATILSSTVPDQAKLDIVHKDVMDPTYDNTNLRTVCKQ